MQRITVSLDDETAALLDRHVSQRGYASRSEAVRDLVRDLLSRDLQADSRQAIGILSYMFDHERRDLASKLTQTHHHHHVLNLSTLHLHLDHHLCLEVAVLRGKANEIQALADQVSSETGVHFGELRLLARDADPATALEPKS